MAEEKYQQVEVGTIGRHSMSQKGGADPQSLVDAEAKKLKVPLTYQFPEDLPVHQFLMIFYEYNFDQKISKMKESIVLPMPPSIVDKYGMEYNTQDMGTTGAAAGTALDMGIGLMRNPELARKEGKTDQDGITNMVNDSITFGTAALAQLNPFKDQINAPIEQAFGGIANPHTAVLFKSMKLKEFEFTWKLYPQSKNETNSLNNIIHLIRMRSHPSFHYNKIKKEDGTDSLRMNNAFLKYPHEVDLYYLGGSGMHKFKRCVINNLSVNYTPEGGLNFNAGTGAPTFIELTMSFTETQIWTAEDFGAEPSPIPNLKDGSSIDNLLGFNKDMFVEKAPPDNPDTGAGETKEETGGNVNDGPGAGGGSTGM